MNIPGPFLVHSHSIPIPFPVHSQSIPVFPTQSQEWQEYSLGMNQECPRPFRILVPLLINVGKRFTLVRIEPMTLWCCKASTVAHCATRPFLVWHNKLYLVSNCSASRHLRLGTATGDRRHSLTTSILDDDNNTGAKNNTTRGSPVAAAPAPSPAVASTAPAPSPGPRRRSGP